MKDLLTFLTETTSVDPGMHMGWLGLIIPGATALVGAIGKVIVDAINAWRQHNQDCPKHCITKKPLRSKKGNAKPKG